MMAAIWVIFTVQALEGDIYSSFTASYFSKEITIYGSHGLNSRFSQKNANYAHQDYLLLSRCCINNDLLMRGGFPSDELMLRRLLLCGQ